MSLNDVQHQIHKWIRQFQEGYWQPHEILARPIEEVGELAREINHRFGPKIKKPQRILTRLATKWLI